MEMEEDLFSAYIIKPKTVDRVPYHRKGKWEVFVCDRMGDLTMLPESKVWAVASSLTPMPQEKVLDFWEGLYIAHTHDVDEAYIVIGEEGAAKGSITLDDETYAWESPCSLYVPAGAKHKFKFSEVNKTVTVVGIVLKGTYP